MSDEKDHSKRYLDRPYLITAPGLSKSPYGPFRNYREAFELIVEMYGSEEEVPADIEIDVIDPRKRLKLLPPEKFEIDLKKSWGVILDQ